MSRKNNVNPEYYKLAGRDRAHEDAASTARPADDDAPARGRKKGDGPPPNLIPGAPPVGERPDVEDAEDE